MSIDQLLAWLRRQQDTGRRRNVVDPDCVVSVLTNGSRLLNSKCFRHSLMKSKSNNRNWS